MFSKKTLERYLFVNKITLKSDKNLVILKEVFLEHLFFQKSNLKVDFKSV